MGFTLPSGCSSEVTKSLASPNPYNMVRATFKALEAQMSPRQVAAKRGKKISEIVATRDGRPAKAEEQQNGR